MQETTQTVAAIEGITPQMLWNFFIVLLGIIAVFVAVEKVVDSVWKWKDRKRKSEQGTSDDFADEVSDRVMKKLEPQLQEINEKLRSDKLRLDNHDYALNGIHKTQQDISEGFSVLCYAMIAVLNHGIHNGSTEEMEAALDKLHRYLTKRSIDN